MSSLITPQQWADYKALMKDAHDTFSNKVLIWKRLRSTLDRYGEDNEDNNYDNVNLNVLCNYNFMRSWPVTFQTETGGLDRQSVQIMINKQYLSELGYINGDGYLDYDPVSDRFILDGLLHAPFGDTAASQMQSDDVFITLILKREETETHNKRQ